MLKFSTTFALLVLSMLVMWSLSLLSIDLCIIWFIFNCYIGMRLDDILNKIIDNLFKK